MAPATATRPQREREREREGDRERESDLHSTTVCMRVGGSRARWGREGASNAYKPTFLSASDTVTTGML